MMEVKCTGAVEIELRVAVIEMGGLRPEGQVKMGNTMHPTLKMISRESGKERGVRSWRELINNGIPGRRKVRKKTFQITSELSSIMCKLVLIIQDFLACT